MLSTESTFSGRSLLLVEDNADRRLQIASTLEQKGCVVSEAGSFTEGVAAALDLARHFDVAIVDMYIPLEAGHKSDRVMRGEELAVLLRKHRPTIRIIGISDYLDRIPFTPLSDLFSAFIQKKYIPYGSPPTVLLETIEGLLAGSTGRKPRTFIVHGHDESALLTLKNYIQNTLHLDEPTILREKPSLGRTIIEKFESETERADVVFVLLTPDDPVEAGRVAGTRRSRQNVIFELGFFYGKMGRACGKIILLHKGELELPSDIAGVIYIDISKGVEAAGEEIRTELSGQGWSVGRH